MDPAAQLPKFSPIGDESSLSGLSASGLSEATATGKEALPIETVTTTTANQSFAAQTALKHASDSNPTSLPIMTFANPSSLVGKVSTVAIGRSMTLEEESFADEFDAQLESSTGENSRTFEDAMADEFDAQFESSEKEDSQVLKDDMADAFDDQFDKQFDDFPEEETQVTGDTKGKTNGFHADIESTLFKGGEAVVNQKSVIEDHTDDFRNISNVGNQENKNVSGVQLLAQILTYENSVAIELVDGELIESKIEERHFKSDKVIFVNREQGHYVYVGLSSKEKSLAAAHPGLKGLRGIEISQEQWLSSRDSLKNVFLQNNPSATKEQESADRSPVYLRDSGEKLPPKKEMEKLDVKPRVEVESNNFTARSGLLENKEAIKVEEQHHLQERLEQEREAKRDEEKKDRINRDVKKDELRYRHIGGINKRSYIKQEIAKEKKGEG